MRKALKYLGLFVFLPLWWLQLLIPRKKNIWVFGAWNGDRFSDNSKYLFLHAKNYHPEIAPIWLTRNKLIRDKIRKEGGTAFLMHEIRGIYYSLRARAIIVSSGKNDINNLFVNGAMLIHLWHGNPLKKIGLDDRYSLVNSFQYQSIIRYIFPMSYEFNYDYMVSNGPAFTEIMASSYDLPLPRILETGCPRNDVFYTRETDKFNESLRVKFKGCKLVYYLPTFRSAHGSKNLFTLEDYDQDKIESFLQTENIVFVSKGHYVDTILKSNSEKLASRIVHLSDKDVSDINFMLKDADALVTDYSSAYFDFLLTERPILFAAFDLEEYVSESRELYFEYTEVVAGPIVKNWEELCASMTTIWGNDMYLNKVKEKNQIFNKYHDNNNSQRVFEAISKLMQ